MERAILTAIAMHPDLRPPNIAAFREMFHTGSLPPSLLPLVPGSREWREAVSENRWLLVLTTGLLALSVLVTFLQ
jgi:hypothetical protein